MAPGQYHHRRETAHPRLNSGQLPHDHAPNLLLARAPACTGRPTPEKPGSSRHHEHPSDTVKMNPLNRGAICPILMLIVSDNAVTILSGNQHRCPRRASWGPRSTRPAAASARRSDRRSVSTAASWRRSPASSPRPSPGPAGGRSAHTRAGWPPPGTTGRTGPARRYYPRQSSVVCMHATDDWRKIYFRDVNSCFFSLVSRHNTVTPSSWPTQSDPKHADPNLSETRVDPCPVSKESQLPAPGSGGLAG